MTGIKTFWATNKLGQIFETGQNNPAGYTPNDGGIKQYGDVASFPATGEPINLYIAINDNTCYRWDGTNYVKVGGSDAAEDIIYLSTDEFAKNQLGTQIIQLSNMTDIDGNPLTPPVNIGSLVYNKYGQIGRILSQSVGDINVLSMQPTYISNFFTYTGTLNTQIGGTTSVAMADLSRTGNRISDPKVYDLVYDTAGTIGLIGNQTGPSTFGVSTLTTSTDSLSVQVMQYTDYQTKTSADLDEGIIYIIINAPVQIVTSVNGQTGTVIIDKTSIGLGQVDNTSDIDKPLSTATTTALNTEQTARIQGDAILQAQINGLSNLGLYTGTYDTFASLPTDTSSFPNGVSVNDFANVRADENNNGQISRYVIDSITGTTINWRYDIPLSSDLTGKMDLIPTAGAGNIAVWNSAGQVIDGGPPQTFGLDREVRIDTTALPGVVNDTGSDLVIPLGVFITDDAESNVLPAETDASLKNFLGELRTNIKYALNHIWDKADKLTTARTIRTNLASTTAVNFDGTANITPGITGTLPITNGGTGNTNGLAASATKLATARTIITDLTSTASASFDGQSNISAGATGILPTTKGGTGLSTIGAADTVLVSNGTTLEYKPFPTPASGKYAIEHGDRGNWRGRQQGYVEWYDHVLWIYGGVGNYQSNSIAAGGNQRVRYLGANLPTILNTGIQWCPAIPIGVNVNFPEPTPLVFYIDPSSEWLMIYNASNSTIITGNGTSWFYNFVLRI